MKKILITGISGFAGSFLTEHFVRKGETDIYGTTLTLKHNPNLNEVKDWVTLEEINLLDFEKVKNFIEKLKPDRIFHLAALASTKLSFEDPTETIVNNISAEVNLLEAVKRINNYNPRILITSSADVYGLVAKKYLPITESTPLNPTNPYAVSKIAQDFLGLQYFNSYKLSIIRVRPFNHIGPRQALNFVVSDFAKKIVDIEKGKTASIIKVGNLSSKRDFTDVRDMVRAYDLILEKGEVGEVYNIGSGKSESISGILQILLSLSSVKIAIKKDSTFLRPADNPELRCDSAKLISLTGWKPEISLRQTLKDTLDYWRNIS